MGSSSWNKLPKPRVLVSIVCSELLPSEMIYAVSRKSRQQKRSGTEPRYRIGKACVESVTKVAFPDSAVNGHCQRPFVTHCCNRFIPQIDKVLHHSHRAKMLMTAIAFHNQSLSQ
jgi:hypothetical protein